VTGYADGYNDGYTDGRRSAKGYPSGYAEGYDDGWRQAMGLLAGAAQQMAAVPERVLADKEELMLWLPGVLADRYVGQDAVP